MINRNGRKPKTVNEAFAMAGHDEDFEPLVSASEYEATGAVPGSEDKVAILRDRIEKGHPLWHPLDRCDFSGMKGGVAPRNQIGDSQQSVYSPRVTRTIGQGRTEIRSEY